MGMSPYDNFCDSITEECMGKSFNGEKINKGLFEFYKEREIENKFNQLWQENEDRKEQNRELTDKLITLLKFKEKLKVMLRSPDLD